MPRGRRLGEEADFVGEVRTEFISGLTPNGSIFILRKMDSKLENRNSEDAIVITNKY